MLDISSIQKIEPEQVEVTNLLRQRIQPFLVTVPIGENALPVSFDLRQKTEIAGSLLTVELESEFGNFTLKFGMDLLNLFCDLWLLGWKNESETALPVEWRVVTALHFLWQLTAFADKTWDVISVLQSEETQHEPGLIEGTLIVGDTKFGAGMKATVVKKSAFCDLFEQALAPASSELDLEWELTTRLPVPDLTLSEAMSIGTGDVLIVSGAVETAFPATASVAGRSWDGFLDLHGTFTAENNTDENSND